MHYHRRQLSVIALTIFGIFGLYDQFSIFSSPSSTSFANAKDGIHMITENLFKCEMDVTNPWDPSVNPYIKDPPPSCEGSYRNLTYINDGFIRINPDIAREGTTCQWQCLIPGEGEEYSKGPWESTSGKPTCDIMKVRCFTGDSAEDGTYYENLHVQIIPKQLPSPGVSPTAYNVHIFLVDSVSRSQGLRFLSKTIDHLSTQHEAIHFPFYNKVAYNSLPNGYAAFVGQRPLRDNVPPTIARTLCDNQTFDSHYIGNILQRNGYATLFNEDMFSIFPNELKYQPTHTLAPLGFEYKKSEFFNKTYLYDDQCQTSMDFMTEYFTKFVSTYGSKPKFSLNWNTYLSHDQLNHLRVADDSLVEFLKANKKELDNSFFIFMGDHGPNFGYYRYEDVIYKEEMNPMFYISLPKALRNDKNLQHVLKENSKKIISHFDLYASLIDIATTMGADIPSNTALHGLSFFKPIPDGRDCGSMGISPMYCGCRYKRQDVPSEDILRVKIIDAIFDQANETIWPFKDDCIVPVYNRSYTPKIEQVFVPGTTPKLRVYHVVFETTPKNARWWTYVYVTFENNGNIKVQNMIGFGNRINPFASQRRCFNAIMDFCFCKAEVKEL